jgi:hypothetical protein
MVVAVGLSGTFLVLLSSLLAEALRLGTITQSELIAIKSVDLLAENALNTPFQTLQENRNSTNQVDLIVVETDPTDQSTISTNPHRARPVQLSLIQNDSIWGSFNPITGTLSFDNRWTKTKGNYFRGHAFQEISDSSGTLGLPSFKVTNRVYYSNSATSQFKERIVYVFKNAGKDQGIAQ